MTQDFPDVPSGFGDDCATRAVDAVRPDARGGPLVDYLWHFPPAQPDSEPDRLAGLGVLGLEVEERGL